MKINELSTEDKEQIKSFDCLNPPDFIHCHTCPLAVVDKSIVDRCMITLLADCLVFEALNNWKKTLDPDFDVDMGKLMAIKNEQYSQKKGIINGNNYSI